MKLGTNDRKKVILLAVLAVAAGYLVYSNLLSSPGSGSSQPAQTAALQPETVEAPPPPVRPARGGGQSDEFHPVLHSKRPEDRIDLSKVDPTLRLDLLAKLQVEPSPSARNLFQFGPPPTAAAALKGPEPKILPKPIALKPAAATPVSLGATGPASIPLKYYGFTSAPGNSPKTAFFLDGDEILVGKEGDMLERRYRVVRISPSTVVMEDTQSKREQTLHMEDLPG